MPIEIHQARDRAPSREPSSVLWLLEKVPGLGNCASDFLELHYPGVTCESQTSVAEALALPKRFDRAMLWYHEKYATDTVRFSGTNGTPHVELLNRFIAKLADFNVPFILICSLYEGKNKPFPDSLACLSKASMFLTLRELENGAGRVFLLGPPLQFGERLTPPPTRFGV